MALQTIEELEEKIELVLKEKQGPAPNLIPANVQPQPETSSGTMTRPENESNSNFFVVVWSHSHYVKTFSCKFTDDVVCEGNVCVNQTDIDAKVARAKQLIEEKRKEKEELQAKVKTNNLIF